MFILGSLNTCPEKSLLSKYQLDFWEYTIELLCYYTKILLFLLGFGSFGFQMHLLSKQSLMPWAGKHSKSIINLIYT